MTWKLFFLWHGTAIAVGFTVCMLFGLSVGFSPTLGGLEGVAIGVVAEIVGGAVALAVQEHDYRESR